ncbi:MAG: hypothetical protein LBR10_05710 [Prevotellaceae bacterium]|jgi:V/A-type H+-transporting ATPase subunit I|nr:hypothetical protein [Prevotellaceae bacterium]
MVKYSFLLYHNDLSGFLEQLQQAGMIHVESRDVRPDEETNAILRKAENLDKIRTALKAVEPKKANTETLVPFKGSADVLAETYLAVTDKMAKLDASIKKTEKDMEEATPWGDFNDDDIERISQLGVTPRFYAAPIKQFIRYQTDKYDKYTLYEINRDKHKVYFVILQDTPDFDFELQEIKPPSASSRQLFEELNELREEYRHCSTQLKSLALSAEILSDERRLLLERIDFNTAKLSAKSEVNDSVKMLTGWLPKDSKPQFNAFLETQNAIYFAEEKPENHEEPPVLLKNGKFAALFEPLTKMYSLPNYRELDTTPFLAPFFMLFFGFCLGDGGYGLLIAIAASLLKWKIKDSSIRPFLTLAQWFGLSTLLFGFITATFFGISINQIKLDMMAEKYFGLSENYGMMILSLLLGVFQIIFAMFVNVANIVRQQGWKYSLHKLAWIVVITGGAALYLLKDSADRLSFNITLAICGLAAIIALFYNSPEKNIFVNFGSGLWTTYNMASGLLGDILSYIRLFALGMTGGILGSVFNKLAMDTGAGMDIPVVSQLITLVILLFGHSLNFTLNILGATIHPMRLTFVEFYKNEGFEGGGFPFKLFKKS